MNAGTVDHTQNKSECCCKLSFINAGLYLIAAYWNQSRWFSGCLRKCQCRSPNRF